MFRKLFGVVVTGLVIEKGLDFLNENIENNKDKNIVNINKFNQENENIVDISKNENNNEYSTFFMDFLNEKLG